MTTPGAAFVRTTAIAGVLDLLSAFVFGGMAGRTPMQILRGVASGPFGPGMTSGGVPAALVGVAVHFAIMTVVVAVYFFAARRIPRLLARPLLAGAAYGLVVYGVMYWVVLPLRWPTRFPDTQLWNVTNALISHVLLIGLSIGVFTARWLAPGPTPARRAEV